MLCFSVSIYPSNDRHLPKYQVESLVCCGQIIIFAFVFLPWSMQYNGRGLQTIYLLVFFDCCFEMKPILMENIGLDCCYGNNASYLLHCKRECVFWYHNWTSPGVSIPGVLNYTIPGVVSCIRMVPHSEFSSWWINLFFEIILLLTLITFPALLTHFERIESDHERRKRW